MQQRNQLNIVLCGKVGMNSVRLSVKNRFTVSVPFNENHLVNEAVQLVLTILQDRKVLQV